MLLLAAAGDGGAHLPQRAGRGRGLFDYQLRQMALSLRDQGEIAPAQAGPLADNSSIS
jgi:hypothetical protein